MNIPLAQDYSRKRLPELSHIEATVLDIVRKSGPLSRTSLSEHLETSRASMTGIVGGLLDAEVLIEIGKGKSEGGRPPKLLDLNRELGYIAGVDIGATSLDLALADFTGKILERISEPANVRGEAEPMLSHISDLIGDMLATQGADTNALLGMGIGVPGPVQFPAGLLIEPPLIPKWEGFPIKDYFRERFPNARPIVDNDVNIMALGEQQAGAGVDFDNFFYVKIGTGIGCGIICHGEVYRGNDGCAGDIGHICVDYNGPICHCGNKGCLAIMAGAPTIAEKGRQAAENGQSDFLARRLKENGGVLTSIDVGEAASAGDRSANAIIQETGSIVGGVLAGLINFYNPQAIFIGGGVSKIGHRFLSAIRQATLHRATALSTRSLRIDYSQLGDDAGVRGAICLATENVFAAIG